MGPKPTMPSSGDLYRSRLDQILDQRHELFRLAGLIDWDRFDQAFGRFYRPLRRPAKPTRLMVGLSYLPHTFNLSKPWCNAGQKIPIGSGSAAVSTSSISFPVIQAR